MANNEIKVTVKADNKQFLNALTACSKKLTEFSKSAGKLKLKEQKITVALDKKQVAAGVREIRNLVKSLTDTKVSLSVDKSELQGFTDKLHEIVQALKGVKEQSEKVKAPSGLLDTLSKATIAGYGLAEVLGKVKALTEALVGTGLRYNQQMETSKLGIAGILLSMTEVNGKQLQMNQALQISGNLLDQMQKKAATIGLPAEDMMAAFQSVIGPGLEAKMTLQELVDFVPTATKAVKTMLGSIANEQQISQELRAMVSGDINMDAQVSKALGITKEGVDEAKKNAGGLFTYLMEKMSGFQAIATIWPDTMTGALEKFKTMYGQSAGGAFEKVFDKAKKKLNDLTDALFVVDEKTKKINFSPELLSRLQAIVDNTILFAEKIIAAGNAVIPYLGTPLDVIGSLLKFIVDNIYGITTAITTWVVIEKAVALMQFLKKEVAAVKAQYVLLKAQAAAAMTTASAGAGAATGALGKMTKALIAVKAAIRGLASTTLWGAISVAAGFAVEKIIGHLDKIDSRKREKEDYFTKRASMDAPLPELLQGKLQKPVYGVNSEVNMAGIKPAAKEKLEKYISAINYLFPDKAVTVTSGLRDWGGHTKGTKADIDVQGFQDPLFKNQLINLANEFGIAVQDETKAPASMSKKALEEWGPHLDLDLMADSVNLEDIQRKAREKTDAEKKEAKALAKAQEALANAIAEGKLKEYLADLNAQEKALENRYANTKAGQHPDGETDISQADYTAQKKTLANSKAMAEIEQLEQEKQRKLDTMQYLDKEPEKLKAQAEAEKIQSEIDLKRKNLEMALKELDQAEFTAQKALEDQARDVKAAHLEKDGELVAAVILRLEKQNRALRESLKANGMEDALKLLDENEQQEIRNARFSEVQQKLEHADNELLHYQERLLNSVVDSSVDAKDVLQDYVDKFHELIDDKLADLRVQLREALAKGDKENVGKLRAEIRGLKETLENGLINIIAAYEKELQMEIAEINANRGLTSRQKQDLIDEAQRDFYRKEAQEKRSRAEKYRRMDAEENTHQHTAEIENLEREATLKEKLAELPTLLDKVHEASKQAFEDGLLDFLERGIFECESLGDAFRSLATTILQSIQRVYAEAMTKSIMGSLFPSIGGNGGSKAFTTDYSSNDWLQPYINGLSKFADGGLVSGVKNYMSGGLTSGPGTSTSDSILARLCPGEFVFDAATVKRVGLNTLQRIKSGDIYNIRIPMPKFAQGGLVGAAGVHDAAKGMEGFTAGISNNFSPRTSVDVRIDGDGIVKSLANHVKKAVRSEMMENAKLHSQIMKRVW